VKTILRFTDDSALVGFAALEGAGGGGVAEDEAVFGVASGLTFVTHAHHRSIVSRADFHLAVVIGAFLNCDAFLGVSRSTHCTLLATVTTVLSDELGLGGVHVTVATDAELAAPFSGGTCLCAATLLTAGLRARPVVAGLLTLALVTKLGAVTAMAGLGRVFAHSFLRAAPITTRHITLVLHARLRTHLTRAFQGGTDTVALLSTVLGITMDFGALGVDQT